MMPLEGNQHLYPVRISSDQWGFIDCIGNLAIPPRFRHASEFRECVAVVNTQRDGLAAIDLNGQQLFEVQNVKTYSSFSEGLLACENNTGKSGFIDMKGNLVIPFIFDNTLNFSQGTAPAQQGGLWGAIDQTGQWQFQPSFNFVMKWGNGEYSAAQLKNCSWVIIDRRGAQQTERTFRQVYPQLNGYIVVRFENGTWALLDSDLRTCWDKELNDIDHGVIEGTLAAAQKDLWGVLDTSGDWTIQPQYTNVSSVIEGRRSIYVGGSRRIDYALTGGLVGFLDEENSVVIPPSFADARDFDHGLAKVSFYCKEDPNGANWYSHWGYIDLFGNLVWSNRK